MQKVYRAFDLFSGCGGLSLGLEKAGFTVKIAVEIDPITASTYQRNHRQTKVLNQDIRGVTGKKLLSLSRLKRGDLDLLAACAPCQGFSSIKRKNKAVYNDERNNLILEFLRIAKETFPKTILLENVPGLAEDSRFDYLLRSLRGLGYICRWAILNAADYSVPQRRRRLIMIASRIGKIELPDKRVKRVTVGDKLIKLKGKSKSKDPLHNLFQHCTQPIKEMILKIPKNGGSRRALQLADQLACHRKKNVGFNDVYGRMKWNDVAPTLTGGCYNPSKGRFLHPYNNRPITMREAAYLQSFPKGYKFPVEEGLTVVAKMIGDAVPPNFSKYQGIQIREHLESYK